MLSILTVILWNAYVAYVMKLTNSDELKQHSITTWLDDYICIKLCDIKTRPRLELATDE